MSNEWAIEAHGLVKDFGEQRAVDHVDLQVAPGVVYGVLGPNGAGKTTTIRMLATLLGLDGGEAKIFGYDVVKDAHQVRQLIGVTGQYASVDETLTARENLDIFCRLQGLKGAAIKSKSDELLESFGLTDAANKPLEKFSGGMRRRLDLAASLISRPPLIFLDEPTTGLDPRTRSQMWDTIRGLVNDGSTVLLTTQYLDEADQLASRIAVIDTGRVVAEGTSDDLKALVGSSALQLTLDETADAVGALSLVEGIVGAKGTLSPESRRVNVPLTDTAVVTDVLLALRERGIAVTELSLQKPSLDEVFLSITGHPAEPAAELSEEVSA
ncbi:MAG: ATP-binding cassette domain-containing protein [Demequina sp.]|nr:ATP-binding cassette domain-containing protein [Demequina sp.]